MFLILLQLSSASFSPSKYLSQKDVYRADRFTCRQFLRNSLLSGHEYLGFCLLYTKKLD